MSARRAGLVLLSIGSPAVLLATLLGGRAAEWTVALAGPALPAGLVLLAAGPALRGTVGRVLLATWLAGEAAAAAVALLVPRAGGPLWFGLPAATVILALGLGLLPLLVVPLAYATSFREPTAPDASPPEPGDRT